MGAHEYGAHAPLLAELTQQIVSAGGQNVTEAEAMKQYALQATSHRPGVERYRCLPGNPTLAFHCTMLLIQLLVPTQWYACPVHWHHPNSVVGTMREANHL